MVKYTFGSHELEFEEELVETFEKEVPDVFGECIECYLCTDLKCSSLETIFDTHTKEELQQIVINAAKQEIALYKGE